MRGLVSWQILIYLAMRSCVNGIVALVLLGAVRAAYFPDLTPDEFDNALEGKHALLEFYAPWCGHCKKLAPEFELLGKAFATTNDVVIAQIDADKHKSLGKDFGIKGYPTLKWISKGKDPRKDTEDVNVARNAEALITYVNERVGTAKKLSKPVSKVVELTAENFERVVLDAEKDVLAEFFAPWCGHCKSLKPVYDSLSVTYEDEDDIVIAAIDCDAHKDVCQKYDVGGFPTLKWFSKKDKDEPIKYESNRDLASFVQFINEKTGADLTPMGDVVDGAGLVAELSELARAFHSSEEKASSELLAQIEAKVTDFEGRIKKNAEYYAKVAKNILAKGASYVSTEKTRSV